ncbi:hypothetical protein LIER_39716 [Lithospermum erythrorhizon]|uniref:Pentatricopeptide repeat-containing protein n=1 Tax=Lithospermum erythrorhizon TaxID=34254 RepID=A0AAV3QM37_LITER
MISSNLLYSLLFNSTKLGLNHLNQIHSLIITCNLSHSPLFLSKILSHCLYLPKFPCVYASSLLNQIKQPNVHTYNTIFRGFSTSIHYKKTIFYFKKMRKDCIFPNKHTFPLILKPKKTYPFQIFTQIMKFGFGSDQFVQNSLVSCFASWGCIDCAYKVFDEMEEKDVFGYSALIDGYVKNGKAEEALELFVKMRLNGVEVDEVVVVSVICGVGMLGCVWFGKWIHGFYIESGRVSIDVHVGSALVDMYCKCGFVDDAFSVFYEMNYRNVVSWSALIGGCVQCERYKEGLLVFQQMLADDKVKPNESTLTSVLAACAQLGALDQGRWVHKYIERRKLEVNCILGTGLINMYSKCGCLEEANLVFERMTDKDNVYTWTAMINGFAINGDGFRALSVFSKMLLFGVKPNAVTFIGVLSACSHGGLVDEGKRLFSTMESVYGIQPNVEHYGCMVDLLGRAGHLAEAMKLIQEMPIEPTPGLWGVLFGACLIHKAYELGNLAGKHLMETQPHHSGNYTTLANLYSACQNWKDAAYVRKTMKTNRVEKTPGWSWIELEGVVHKFVAFDKTHIQTKDLYLVLGTIYTQMVVDAVPVLSTQTTVDT